MQTVIKMFFIMGFLYASNTKAQSLYIIKLKSGVVLKCELVKMVPDSFVWVKQYDTITKIFYTDIVSLENAGSVKKDVPSDSVPSEKRKIIPGNIPEKAWHNGFRIGVSLNQISGNFAGYEQLFLKGNTVRFCALRRLNKRIEAGFNIGLEPLYEMLAEEGALLGVFAAELRYGLLKSRSARPFLYCEGGYASNFSTQSYFQGGGKRGVAGIGYSSGTKSQRCIFSIMAGYKMQYLKLSGFVREGPNWVPQIFNVPFQGGEVCLEWRF